MEDIKLYNLAREQIENPFIGLPCASSRLIQLLITRANPSTGIVDNLTYRDLATLLIVDHAPGRKGAGIPKIETIRSYLRTVAKCCSNDFRIITDGQKLKFQFTNMPKIYALFFDKKEVYREEESGESRKKNTIDSINKPALLGLSNTQKNEELATDGFFQKPVKNINIINKQNKLTTSEGVLNHKKPISADFSPNQETIEIALSRGLNQVLNSEELKKFVHYNLANGCQWVDFNPIFIKWLEREREYSQLKQRNNQPTQGKARSRVNEYSAYTNSYESAMAAVLQANADACPPCSPSFTDSFDENESFSVEYLVAMATANRHIRPVVY
ncbi:hypothetical protein Lnau_3099 [Legionella nautarum]|uniref:DnaT DNA-binding domain-containing protein n=1 Tax=Legionella nautarum TaxID=45070 RepID=A0A0W0WIK0_9GAMM|nr:hypothetical protein [Legionella nautarum]KTD32188.1 hypothetical protein Lnau_3099 [Legionella nautarum]